MPQEESQHRLSETADQIYTRYQGRLGQAIISALERREEAAAAVRKEQPHLFIEPKRPRTPREKQRYRKRHAKEERRRSQRAQAIDAKLLEWGDDPTPLKKIVEEAILTQNIVDGNASDETVIEHLETILALPEANAGPTDTAKTESDQT